MRSLFGYGVTAKAIAKEGTWHIFDDTFKSVKKDEYGNILMPSDMFDARQSELEITSAGIPPSNPLIKKAQNLISELDYFYNKDKLPFQIWITGTNGKTTTTQMIHYLLKNHKSDIGGNIGIPLADMNKNANFWVVEVSSFQLHYTKFAKPNIFVILPVKEDHISWHGSFENYVNAKLSPISRMTQRDIVIAPKNLNLPDTKAYVITYADEYDLIKRFDIKNTRFETPFLLDEILAKIVYKILFFKEKMLSDFTIDPHKMEEITDSKKRLWINDSKATNVDATINALKRYKNKHIHLILGGDNKGQNFDPLFKYLQNMNVTLYIIGKNTELFEKKAKEYEINHKTVFTLENAVTYIKKKLNEHDVAMLSPACASFDQFKGYKHRGEIFKKLILNPVSS